MRLEPSQSVRAAAAGGMDDEKLMDSAVQDAFIMQKNHYEKDITYKVYGEKFWFLIIWTIDFLRDDRPTGFANEGQKKLFQKVLHKLFKHFLKHEYIGF